MPEAFQFRRGVRPDPWQLEAASAWRAASHPTFGPRHGIIEAVTGTGKTIAAMACIVDAAAEVPDLRVAVVVPGKDLAAQWRKELLARLELRDEDVEIYGGGQKGSFRRARVVVWVIHSARQYLPAACRGVPVLLIVDECHRSASTENRNIYDAETRFRLGLSATATLRTLRDERTGQLLPLERQPHGLALGRRVYSLTVAGAVERGLLPSFRIVHHGLFLSSAEQGRYRLYSNAIDQAYKDAATVGVGAGQVGLINATPGGSRWTPTQRAAAEAVKAAQLARKHFLYRSAERNRVALCLLMAEFAADSADSLQAVCFNERITGRSRRPADGLTDGDDEPADDLVGDDLTESGAEDEESEALAPEVTAAPGEAADELFEALRTAHDDGRLKVRPRAAAAVRRHHSRARDPGVFSALRLRVGDPKRTRVLVSVKSATEGIDMPSVDLGIVVASSSSALQRIQTLGRILRPRRGPDGEILPPDPGARVKTLHVLYFKDTADQEIYLNTDWDELLGKERNEWMVWSHGASTGTVDLEPPRPPLSEIEAEAVVGAHRAAGKPFPIIWPSRPPKGGLQLVYTNNAVRFVKNGPTVARHLEIERLFEDALLRVNEFGRAQGLPAVSSTDLRGSFFVTPGGWVVRGIPAQFKGRLDVRDHATGRLQKQPMFVLFHVDWDLNPDQGDVTLTDEQPKASKASKASKAQSDDAANPVVGILRDFVASGGEAVGSDAASALEGYPEVQRLITTGVGAAERLPSNLDAVRVDRLVRHGLWAASTKSQADFHRVVELLSSRSAPAAKAALRLLRAVCVEPK